ARRAGGREGGRRSVVERGRVTMTDGHALLRAIEEAPEDDAPRLVYADWLEENGDDSDLARSEFIRLQCARVRGGGAKPSKREAELLARFGAGWRGELPGQLCGVGVRRGVILSVRPPAAHLTRWGGG